MPKPEVQRRFPIIGGPSILWDVIAPYEKQALRNHSQSLQRLAERGGLSPEEAWCVMHSVGLFGPEWKTAKENGLRFVQELVRAEHAPRYSDDAVDALVKAGRRYLDQGVTLCHVESEDGVKAGCIKCELRAAIERVEKERK